jgi:heme exporter protein D
LRWIDLLALSLIGLAIAYPLSQVLSEWATGVQVFFGNWEVARQVQEFVSHLVPAMRSGGFASFCLVIGTGVPPLLITLMALPLAALVNMHGLALKHLRFALCYPPTWFSAGMAIIGSGLLAALSGHPNLVLGYSYAVWIWAVFVVLIAALVAIASNSLLVHRKLLIFRRVPASHNRSDLISTSDETFERFTADTAMFERWLERESPIELPEQDLFGVRVAAERVASALSRNGFRVNRRGFALIWKSDNALVT